MMLPDMSVSSRQKLVENAKIQKLKCDFFCNFPTVCGQTNGYPFTKRPPKGKSGKKGFLVRASKSFNRKKLSG